MDLKRTSEIEAPCELCGAAAAVRCDADAAYLCRPCDARVHGANFLVARHVRRPIGRNPSPSPSPSASSSSSSSCISSTESTAPPSPETAASRRPRRRLAPPEVERAGRVLEGWSRRLGVGRRCAALAAHVLIACAGGMRDVPFRVAAAAAMWFAVKVCGGGATAGVSACDRMMRRLEMCSGVPAKLIVVAETRLGRVARETRRRVAEEGWGECS